MDLVRQTIAVLMVFALLAAALWWLRHKGLARFGFGASRRRIGRCLQPVERLALSPQHSIHLVRIADRAVLIGLSPASVSLLQSTEWPILEQALAQTAREASGE